MTGRPPRRMFRIHVKKSRLKVQGHTSEKNTYPGKCAYATTNYYYIYVNDKRYFLVCSSKCAKELTLHFFAQFTCSICFYFFTQLKVLSKKGFITILKVYRNITISTLFIHDQCKITLQKISIYLIFRFLPDRIFYLSKIHYNFGNISQDNWLNSFLQNLRKFYKLQTYYVAPVF